MSKPGQKLVRFDWAMKNILRNKANFDILEGFLTCLLSEKITVENILESESNQDDKNQKFNRVDLKCKDSSGRQIIIEVQSERQADYYERMIWGASKTLVESIDIGEDYFKIAKIVSVSILFHDLYYPSVNKDYIYSGGTDIRGRHSKEPFLSKVWGSNEQVTSAEIFPEFHVICVKNFDNKIREQIDEWVYMFKNEKVEKKFNSPGIAAAEKKLGYLSMSREERQKYDNYLFNVSSSASAFATARDEGLEKGRAEGELKAKLETARNLLGMGMSAEKIAQATGFSLAEVKKIAKK